MCGISVIVDSRFEATERDIMRMNRSLSHRGPDFSDYSVFRYHDLQYFLGHTRLSIIDLTDKARQPMKCSSERTAITYNGEIYNYQQLRKQIETYGERFISNCDTEVLLLGLKYHGVDFLNKVEGMYAFAFFDRETRELIVGRDPYGIKPVYYFHGPQGLVVSSEIKAVLQSWMLKKEIDLSQIENLLHFKSSAPGTTFFKNIKELKPGHVLVYKNGEIAERPSFELKFFSGFQRNKHQAHQVLANTKNMIEQSVEQQLVADVGTGIMLSGGVDSTYLLSVIRQLGYKKFPAFSISYHDKHKTYGTDDFHFAQQAATQYDAHLYPVTISPADLAQWPEFMAQMCNPVADIAALNTHFLANTAHKQGVKVLLSGAGADELFAGYNRIKAFAQYLKLRNVLPPNVFQSLPAKLPDGKAYSFRDKLRGINKFLSAMDQKPSNTFANLCKVPGITDQLFVNPNAACRATDAFEVELPTIDQTEHWIAYALNHDFDNYLKNDILAISDMASMANSVELRVPYLNKNLVAYIKSLSIGQLMGNESKWVLKRLLQAQGGDVFAKRSKQGFGLPMIGWLKLNETQYLFDELRNKQNLLFEVIDYQQTQKLIAKHHQGKFDYSVALVGLISISWWLKAFE